MQGWFQAMKKGVTTSNERDELVPRSHAQHHFSSSNNCPFDIWHCKTYISFHPGTWPWSIPSKVGWPRVDLNWSSVSSGLPPQFSPVRSCLFLERGKESTVETFSWSVVNAGITAHEASTQSLSWQLPTSCLYSCWFFPTTVSVTPCGEHLNTQMEILLIMVCVISWDCSQDERFVFSVWAQCWRRKKDTCTKIAVLKPMSNSCWVRCLFLLMIWTTQAM